MLGAAVYLSMTRVGVGHVLPLELASSLREHLYHGLPDAWAKDEPSGNKRVKASMGFLWGDKSWLWYVRVGAKRYGALANGGAGVPRG